LAVSALGAAAAVADNEVAVPKMTKIAVFTLPPGMLVKEKHVTSI
jgi:hypothetical protein